MSIDRAFPAAANSVPGARRFVVEVLSDLPGDVLETVALMVSELATNSVLYARTDFQIRVERTDAHIRIEVADAGGGDPEMQRPSATEAHGRGLRIVDELSEDWGVVPSLDHAGKSVWFTVPLPALANGLHESHN